MDGTDRPWYKIWWVYLAVVAVVVAVTIGVLAVGPADTPTTAPPDDQFNDPFDDSFTTGGLFLDVVVEDLETDVNSITDGPLQAVPAGTFTLVKLSVENNNDEPLDFNAENVQGIDSTGTTLFPDSSATGIVNADNEAVFLEAIQPGEVVTGIIVFDVPMDQTLVAVVVPDWTSVEGREIPLYP